jgi:NitT/TauT family transport system substrate-binding protein
MACWLRRLLPSVLISVSTLAACGGAAAPSAAPASSAAAPAASAAPASTTSSAKPAASAEAKPATSAAANPAASTRLLDMSYGLSSADSATLLPQNVAKRMGIFAKHGLNVELVQIQGGPNTVTAVQSSSLGAGVVSTPLIFNAISQGAPVIATAVEVQGFSMQVTVSNKLFNDRKMAPTDSADKMLEYLKGLKVGGQTPGATTTVVFQGMMKSTGKPADWVTSGNTGTGDATLAALQNGVIDAMVGGSPSGNIAEAGGFGKVIWDSLSVEQFRTLAYGITIQNVSWAESHKQESEALVAALDETQKWILANESQAVDQMAILFPTLPKSQLPAILKGTNFAPTARITPDGMKAAQNLANTFSLTTSQVSDDLLGKSWTDKYFKG